MLLQPMGSYQMSVFDQLCNILTAQQICVKLVERVNALQHVLFRSF